MCGIQRVFEHRFECHRPTFEIADLLKQRHDRQLIGKFRDIGSGRASHGLCPAPQPKYREHVAGSAGQADDVAAQAIRAECRHRGMDQSEQIECLDGLRRQSLTRNVMRPRHGTSEHRLSLLLSHGSKVCCDVQLGQQLPDYLAVDTGILPHIETIHVQAKHTHQIEPGEQLLVNEPLGAIVFEAVDQSLHIDFQLGPIAIRTGRQLRPNLHAQTLFQPPLDHAQPLAIRLHRRNRRQSRCQCGPTCDRISQPLFERRRHGCFVV